MIAVYTTVFGNTKPLHEPHATKGARFICFTDQPIDSPNWDIVRVSLHSTPNRECRKLKQMSHLAVPDATATLWMDSCFSLQVDLPELLDRYPDSIVAFRHPHRNRIRDEAEAIVAHGKAPRDRIMAQLAAYQADGFDTDESPQQRISCGGFLLRRHTPDVVRFNERWNDEVQSRTLRDQMSIDYAAWKTGVSIGYFDGNHLDNPLARFTRYKRAVNDF